MFYTAVPSFIPLEETASGQIRSQMFTSKQQHLVGLFFLDIHPPTNDKSNSPECAGAYLPEHHNVRKTNIFVASQVYFTYM